jgi:methylmalonyl-CoA mutase N-terminal domain/subunit
MVAAIEQNMPQREIAEAAYRYQQEVESDERIVVGVNRYRTEAAEEIHILRIDPELERKQIDRLQAFKARRDSAAVERRIAELADAAAAPDRNLMPVIVDAVRDGVTLGEICDTWRRVWGTWREQPVF